MNARQLGSSELVHAAVRWGGWICFFSQPVIARLASFRDNLGPYEKSLGVLDASATQ